MADSPYTAFYGLVIESFYLKAAAGCVHLALLVAEQQQTYSSNNTANESAQDMLPDI